MPGEYVSSNDAAIAAMQAMLVAGDPGNGEWVSVIVFLGGGHGYTFTKLEFHPFTKTVAGGIGANIAGPLAAAAAWVARFGGRVVGLAHSHPYGEFGLSQDDVKTARGESSSGPFSMWALHFPSLRAFEARWGSPRDYRGERSWGAVAGYHPTKGNPSSGKGIKGPKLDYTDRPAPGGAKGKSGPPETSKGSNSAGTTPTTRGNDYRETGREPGGAGQTTSTGTSTGEKPTERPAGGTMGPFVRNDETFRYDPATGATVRVFTITDVATGAKTTGVETISASGQVSVNNNDSAIEAERERVRQANAEAEKKKEGDEEKDQKPPETKKKDEEEDDGSETGSGGGNNTTRVDPTGDSSGDGDSRPGQFHPNYLTMDARMMLAMADLAWRRGQGPRPPSGGPTDIWQPFKGKTSSAAPEVARSRGRMLEKSAFMDAGLLGALGRQGSHGPSDGSDQIPLTRTVGDEAEAEAAANRDDVRRMLWKKHVEPRILTASQRTRRTP